MEGSGPFTENAKSYFDWINTRAVVKFIAAVDIFYAMLLIGLHLLTLITIGTKSKHHSSTAKPNADNSSTSEDSERGETPTTPKSRETLVVMIWVFTFVICILQLLVAGGLYGGTKQKEGRICIRNCRIWAFTSIFLMATIVFLIAGICIQGKAKEHIFKISVCLCELVFRLLGLLAIQRLKNKIREEICGLDLEEHVLYYELHPTTPSPVHKPDMHPNCRPSRRTYHRTDGMDEYDLDEL